MIINTYTFLELNSKNLNENLIKYKYMQKHIFSNKLDILSKNKLN